MSYMPGATTVGAIFKNGTILASEKRVTYGYALMSKSGKKVFKISNRLGIACAGLISDMQAIARILSAEVRLYEIENNRIIPVRSAAKLLSSILFNHRIMPYFTETLVGGVDDMGPHLFVLDPIGSLIEDKYAALGTGAKIAIGIIEEGYKDNMGLEDIRKIIINAMKTAIGRDAVSGDGIDILIIDESGVREEFIPVA